MFCLICPFCWLWGGGTVKWNLFYSQIRILWFQIFIDRLYHLFSSKCTWYKIGLIFGAISVCSVQQKTQIVSHTLHVCVWRLIRNLEHWTHGKSKCDALGGGPVGDMQKPGMGANKLHIWTETFGNQLFQHQNWGRHSPLPLGWLLIWGTTWSLQK